MCYKDPFIVDSFFIAISLCDDYVFHVYSLNTFELVLKFGEKGRGPNEFYIAYAL